MSFMSYVLLFLCVHHCSSSSTPDKRDVEHSTDSDIGASETVAASAHIGASHIPTRHTISEYHTRVAIPVPQAVPFTVPRPVPFPVHVGVPVDHPRAVLVPVPHPVAHIIARPFAVPIDRPFPYPVAHPVPYTVTQGVGIPVPQPYAVSVPSPVPVKVPVPVPVSAGVAVSTGYGHGAVSSSIVSPVAHQVSILGAHGHKIEHPY